MSGSRHSDDALNIDFLRSLFPITEHKTYLFHGNITPCARPVQEDIQSFLERWSRGGDECWEHGIEAYHEGKRQFAQLINAPEESIAAITNTTMGINLAARILDPHPGSNVVVTELEHASDVYPWLALRERKVTVRYVPARNGAVDHEDLVAAIDDDTAAVCISHVTMGTGFRFDLRAITEAAHAHGSRVVVDAAQSAGSVPIDVCATRVDFLAAPTFKWLFGPLGAGFLYIHPELVTRADPPLPGWFATANPGQNDLHHITWRECAQRFEQGVPPMLSFVGAAAGLRLLHDLKPKNVYARIRHLADYAYAGLTDIGVKPATPADPVRRGGIIAVRIPRHDDLWNHLEQHNIHTGNWLGYLRIDTACYNTVEELDLLLGHVRTFMRSAPSAFGEYA